MRVSLSEIAETAKKATSGCGHPFGIAEEMAYATRWLCERDLPGVEKLLEALEQFQPCTPHLGNNEGNLSIQGKSGDALQALTIAPSAGELMLDGCTKTLTLNTCTQPILLIPFIIQAARGLGILSMHWINNQSPVLTIICSAGGTDILAHEQKVLAQTHVDQIICEKQKAPSSMPMLFSPQHLHQKRQANIANGCQINDANWRKMQQLAHNTYVPVSDQSRLHGAGAGLNDND